jgi:dolichol-phosphate mannosyltransferase
MTRGRNNNMISVVVPVFNEEQSIASLLQKIESVAKAIPISEVIYVDDSSTDSTYDTLRSLKGDYPALRILRHHHRCGQSTALWTGVNAASNDLIATLDGDDQNDPADIARLYDLYKRHKNDREKLMIVGERRKRNDSLSRRLASRFANSLRSALLKDMTKDSGCSLKLFRRRDYVKLPYFDHMHRVLPALMIREGVHLIHVDVSHRPRRHGVSKYNNFGRALVGITDLLGVYWLQARPYAFPVITEDVN